MKRPRSPKTMERRLTTIAKAISLLEGLLKLVDKIKDLWS
jgi:hypothetical protein